MEANICSSPNFRSNKYTFTTKKMINLFHCSKSTQHIKNRPCFNKLSENIQLVDFIGISFNTIELNRIEYMVRYEFITKQINRYEYHDTLTIFISWNRYNGIFQSLRNIFDWDYRFNGPFLSIGILSHEPKKKKYSIDFIIRTGIYCRKILIIMYGSILLFTSIGLPIVR